VVEKTNGRWSIEENRKLGRFFNNFIDSNL